MNNINKIKNDIFENIKHIDEKGYEYWLARELMSALGYIKWQKFESIIEKAKLSCLNSNNIVDDHFTGTGKMVEIGSKTSRIINDYKLSRYACYLIAQNGDPRKETIALAQTYFTYNKNDKDFDKIIEFVENRRNNAYKKVNEELILLYLDVGKYLFNLQQYSKYGDKITTKAANFMKNNYPNIKGFTKRNIERMIQFYKTYKDDKIASTLLTQLSWSSNMLILSNTHTIEERHFYLKLAVKEKYSVRELNRQLQSSYYQRYMLSNGTSLKNTKETINKFDDFPDTRILDTYSLEFLDLPSAFSEGDLKRSIIKNLKEFILEIGKDFTFIGDEYRVQVGNHDYYIDLLFYNRELSCLVAFELKLGEFMPEYVGKMNLYLEALDRDIKKSNENPSVGIILCSSKDKVVVEYSMSKNVSSTLIAEYRLKLIDQKVLEKKLREVKNLLKKKE